VARQTAAASYINFERGVNDANLTSTAFETLLAHADFVHGLGRAVHFMSYGATRADCEYNLAAYLLISTGADTHGCEYRSLPDDWWSGYEAGLGAALESRRTWNGLWRRDFALGVVLVHEPGAGSITVDLGASLRTLDGVATNSVTLGPAEGIVLLR
jgi:hypothetical protein